MANDAASSKTDPSCSPSLADQEDLAAPARRLRYCNGVVHLLQWKRLACRSSCTPMNQCTVVGLRVGAVPDWMHNMSAGCGGPYAETAKVQVLTACATTRPHISPDSGVMTPSASSCKACLRRCTPAPGPCYNGRCLSNFFNFQAWHGKLLA